MTLISKLTTVPLIFFLIFCLGSQNPRCFSPVPKVRVPHRFSAENSTCSNVVWGVKMWGGDQDKRLLWEPNESTKRAGVIRAFLPIFPSPVSPTVMALCVLYFFLFLFVLFL